MSGCVWWLIDKMDSERLVDWDQTLPLGSIPFRSLYDFITNGKWCTKIQAQKVVLHAWRCYAARRSFWPNPDTMLYEAQVINTPYIRYGTGTWMAHWAYGHTKCIRAWAILGCHALYIRDFPWSDGVLQHNKATWMIWKPMEMAVCWT